MLQKTVIYMFIKVYQEPDSVCAHVCVHMWLEYPLWFVIWFVDILGNDVLLTSSKNYVVLF